jgi:hypothetical protein
LLRRTSAAPSIVDTWMCPVVRERDAATWSANQPRAATLSSRSRVTCSAMYPTVRLGVMTSSFLKPHHADLID